MKKNLLFVFLILCAAARSQSLVLTQAANEPVIGDMDGSFYLDTAQFATGLPIGITGTNCAWDFTHLQAQNPVFFTTYADTSVDTNSASFPGCTLIQDDGTLHTFLKSTTTPTTQTEILGLISNTISMTFTNSAIVARYPVSFGSSTSDNISGTYSGFGYSGACTGSITTTADGTGTLMLPGGITLTNVLRVKSVQKITFNQGVFPLANLKQTLYNYYHASKKFAVLSISYQSFGLTISSPSVGAAVTGNSDLFVVGLKENTLDGTSLSVYPNPAAGALTLSLSTQLRPKEIRFYTQLGQLAYQTAYAKSLDVSALAAGIYIMELSTEQGVIRKKIIKQ